MSRCDRHKYQRCQTHFNTLFFRAIQKTPVKVTMIPSSRLSQLCFARARTLHTSSVLCGANQQTKDGNGSVTEELTGKKAWKPYNERVSASATVDEVTSHKTAFDPKTVEPHEEMQKMKDEDEQHESPLECSGANEQASPQSPSKKK